MSKRDYYEVLGVTRTCTEVELKGAFRKLAMQHHPDRNPGDDAAVGDAVALRCGGPGGEEPAGVIESGRGGASGDAKGVRRRRKKEEALLSAKVPHHHRLAAESSERLAH